MSAARSSSLRRPPRRKHLRIAVAAVVAAILVAVGAIAITRALAPEEPAWRLPPANGRFDYQIGGPYAPDPGTAVVVRDWHVRPAKGVYNVCYVDVFQTQPEAEQWWRANHADLLLRRDGQPVEDPNWPDQYLIDTSTAAKRAAIVRLEVPWIAACAKKGFDAVEMDNLDSWYRSGDLLTPEDNLALARALVKEAHGLGLAVAQKNGAVLKSRGRSTARFDFAIAESCEVFNECSSYTGAYGRRVYEIEYTDESGSPFERACAARADQLSIILRDRLVVPKGQPDYRYEAC